MTLSIRPIPAFKDNYIWLLVQDRRAVVVDPGDAAPVLEALTQDGFTLTSILITHHHWDHTGGVAKLVEAFPDVHRFGPAHLPCVNHPVKQGDLIEPLTGVTLQVLAVPGHTLDHLAYLGAPTASPPFLFCGDTLFACGCGRVFEGTMAQMQQSLEQLRALPDTTQIYCAHEYTLSNIQFALQAEPDNTALQQRLKDATELRAQEKPTLPSTLALEKATNPFLRWDAPAILHLAARSQGAAAEQLNATEVFTVLREAKDRGALNASIERA